jgi:DNA-binding transcriptional LysR family regulator
MELRVLRYFLAVVDHGSVTAAADQVRVAQPAISRQLRALEAELGLPLFLREGRSLRLGPAGRRFLPIARDLVARADNARAAMTALAQGVNVSIVVAAHATTIADVIAPFVASRGPVPATPVFVAAPADAAYEALERADVDLAISTRAPSRDVASLVVAEFPVWAQVPPTHPWAEVAEVSFDALVRERLVLLDRSAGTRRAFEAEVAHSGSSYDLAAEVGLSEIAQALAAAGRGVAIVTDEPAYGLRALPIVAHDGVLHIRLHAAWGATHYLAPAIREFAESLAEWCASDSHPTV